MSVAELAFGLPEWAFELGFAEGAAPDGVGRHPDYRRMDSENIDEWRAGFRAGRAALRAAVAARREAFRHPK